MRPIWQALVELAARLGVETGIDSTPEALATIAAEVPFYAGITPEEIGGLGVRWQERPRLQRSGRRRGTAREETRAADRRRGELGVGGRGSPPPAPPPAPPLVSGWGPTATCGPTR